MNTSSYYPGVDCREAMLTTPDGFHLSVRLSIPSTASGVIIMCHGITTNSAESGFFIELEQLFIDSSIACARFDFRGHGASSGTPQDVTLRGELVDVQTVSAWLDGIITAPIFYLAASFGASAAVHIADSTACAGLILINPILDYAGIFIRGESRWGQRIIASYQDDHVHGHDPIGRLPNSNYVVTAQLLKDARADRTFDRMRGTTLPTLIFHGTADALVPIAPVRELRRRNPSIDIVIYEDGRHGLKEFRPDLMERANAWLLDHV